VIGERLGELAALGTACLWTGSYIFFTYAVRRIGADVLNRLRLLIALVCLIVVHWAVVGTPVPTDAPADAWLWLMLSGVVGFAISDAFLFRALYHLGPHRTSLVTSMIPISSALLAWVFFGERLMGLQWLAGSVAVCGIILVVSARRTDRNAVASRRTGLGVLFAVGTVMTQSARYLLSVQGMNTGVPVLSTNVIQILAATVAAWAVAIPVRQTGATLRALGDVRAAVSTTAGAVVGPFLGVTLSLVALSAAPIGVASTLMAMVPILLLPFSRLLFGERITVRTAVGTALAVGGVAGLLLS